MLVNAAWEDKGKKAICRWFVSWDAVGGNELAGAVAGFGGGGAFIVERFYVKLGGEKLMALWIDSTDHISKKEVDFDNCGEKALSICESALDAIWEWNDNDEWGDTDEVVLLKTKRGDLVAKKEMLYLVKDSAPFLRTICEKAGLTAAPDIMR